MSPGRRPVSGDRGGPHQAPARLVRWADAVLLPCFDGTTAPDWVRRRAAGGLGGVCLFARNIGSLEQVAEMTASLAAERESVVIAVDEEAGDVTRIDAATGSRFPGAAALGRVDDIAVTGNIARDVGHLLARVGVSLNLAPCADVVTDLNNPVIGSRAFGGDPDLVSRHTAAWVTGQQSAGVAACAKHFPGHGDTDRDTHRSAAVLHADLATLRARALPPFAAAITAHAAAVMPGHLLAPTLDDVPASVSYRWITGMLRQEMGFDGTVVTDALEMAAVAGPYGIAGAAVRALAAGADLLCVGAQIRSEQEIDTIRDAIVAAVVDGTLTEQRLADAAGRAARVGVAAARALAGANIEDAPPSVAPAPRDPVDVAVGAVDTAGPLPAVTGRVLVVRCEESPNIAVGSVPWGPAPAMRPAPEEVVVHAGEPAPLAAARAADAVLIVTRDRHRHPWMVSITADVRAARPDAVLVEMGISGVDTADAPAVASFGASLANARAVVRVITADPATA